MLLTIRRLDEYSKVILQEFPTKHYTFNGWICLQKLSTDIFFLRSFQQLKVIGIKSDRLGDICSNNIGEGLGMNKKQMEKFKKLLTAERDSVLRHLFELRDENVSQLEEVGGDEVDIASTEITQAAIQKLGNRERKHLARIDVALKKIEEGDYGTCESCGEDIAPARLEARPIALFCIDCKTAQELKERQYIDEDEREDGEGGVGDDDDAVE